VSTEEVCEVVITAPDGEWLAAFVRRLIEDRLAAAGHLFPMRTLYRWQGTLHDEPETRAAIHTRVSLVSAILNRVHAEHPYEVPGAVVLPIATGNPAYLTWIVSETGSA
jgi:periplasmic divalent cation tolerance protein